MNIDGFQQLLDSFSEQNNVPKIPIEDDGYCGLVAHEEMRVFMRFDPGSERFQLFAQLADIPEDRLGPVALQLAQANCHWAGTAGGTLGIGEDSRQAYLQHQVDTDGIDVERLTQLFDDFFDRAGHWQDKLLLQIEQTAPTSREGPLETPELKV